MAAQTSGAQSPSAATSAANAASSSGSIFDMSWDTVDASFSSFGGARALCIAHTQQRAHSSAHTPVHTQQRTHNSACRQCMVRVATPHTRLLCCYAGMCCALLTDGAILEEPEPDAGSFT